MDYTPEFFAGLLWAELRGKPAPRRGQYGKAGEVGPLQIRQCVIDDVSRIYGVPFRLEDAWSLPMSETICRLYLRHYCTAERLGREPTFEDAARIWNGGPDGWQERETKRYWKCVSFGMAKGGRA